MIVDRRPPIRCSALRSNFTQSSIVIMMIRKFLAVTARLGAGTADE